MLHCKIRSTLASEVFHKKILCFAKASEVFEGIVHLDPGCAIFVRDFFRWSVFGIMTKLMGSPKTHGVTGHVGIQEF